MTFAAKLQAMRAKAGLSQKALAEKIGLSATGVAHLEQGHRRPNWETIQKIADAFGVSCDVLRVDEPEGEPPTRKRGRPTKQPAAPPEPAKKTKGKK